MRWNWRARGAAAERYYDKGRYMLVYLYQAATPSVFTKILWPSAPWWLLALTVSAFILGAYLLGRAWLRWGWWQQAYETDVIQNMAPIQRAGYWWAARQAQALGYRLNDIPADLPPEVAEIMASRQR